MTMGELDIETIDKVLNTMDPVSRLVMSDALEEMEGDTERVRAIRHQAIFALEHHLPVVKSISLFGLEFKFALIPPGEFWMGARDDEKDAFEDEKPRHRVRIVNPYYASITPITQEQYYAVMGTNPSHFVGLDGSDKFPVESVNWNDAQQFCRKFTEELEKQFPLSRARLPLEAEWEYMARAGTTTIFPWGDSCNGTQANVNGNFPYGTEEKGPSLGRPCVVGSYAPNNWGLHDVIGQVWEWCEDGWDENAYKKRAAKGIYVVGREGEHRRPFDVCEEGRVYTIRGTADRHLDTGTTPLTSSQPSASESPLEGEQSRPFVTSEEFPGSASCGNVVRHTELMELLGYQATVSVSESLSEGEQRSPFDVFGEALGSTARRAIFRPAVAGTFPEAATTDSASESLSEGEDSSPFEFFVAVPVSVTSSAVACPATTGPLSNVETQTEVSESLLSETSTRKTCRGSRWEDIYPLYYRGFQPESNGFRIVIQ